MDGEPALLKASGVRIGIGERVLCRRLDLELRPGECWGLLGPNGCGKTTLLHSLAGLHPIEDGRLRLGGRDPRHLGRRAAARELGLLPQEHDPRFPASVTDTVLAGRYPHLGPWRWPRASDLAQAARALEWVGLSGLGGRNVQTLSGGERQRAYLAALLAQAPAVMLLDEPVTHLDLREQTRVLTLLRDLADRGHTVLMSLHDLNHALAYCDHLVLLHRGRALVGSTRRIGTARLLGRVFGQPLATLAGPRGPVMVPI